MGLFVKLLSAAVIAAAIATAGAATAATTYTNRAAFEATLDGKFTDTYEDYGTEFAIFSDEQMSGVVGETDYETTGFSNLNIITGPTADNFYCAGCNGSFRLSFTDTSYTAGGGVFGVGFDFFNGSSTVPYSAFVRFANNSTANYVLPVVGQSAFDGFFGVTSTSAITSIHLALNNVATQSGSFGIDNLTIGNAPGGGSTEAVPEPGTWALLIAGFGMAGSALRRARPALASSRR